MRASTLSLRRFLLSSSSSSNLGYRYRTNHSEPSKAPPLPFLRKSYCDESLLLHYLSSGWHHEARNLLHKCSGRDLHARVVRWTSLLTNFCKKGYVDEARMLFDIMPHRNIVTRNAMLSGYLQSGMLNEACRFFENMSERNVVSWTAMLCGFADVGRIEDARKLFDVMPDKNVVSWNSMVAGFIRNGDLEGARMVFEQTPNKNVVSWNAMIAGYAESGRMDEAKALFDQIDQCRNVITWTSMISGYCRAGNVEEGYCLFTTMPEKNVVSWTAMIGGLTWNGLYEEALLLFLQMRLSDAKPNGETFISLAYACAGLCFPCLGKQLHAQLIVNSWKLDDYDGRLRRSLVRMYSVFGLMDSAHNVFEGDLKNCDDQSFNSMINGYIQAGQLEKAQEFFDMVPIRNRIAWTCMIAGYLSAGQVLRACNLFNNMPDRDSIAWTTMINGYVQNELIAEAISLFAEMMAHGVSPINSTYAVLFGTMGSVAYLHWMVRARNKGVKASEQDYFEQLSSSFRCLMDLIPTEKSKFNGMNDKLVVDGANGVGGLKLKVLEKLLSGLVIEVRNSSEDDGVLNDGVGADYVQKEKLVPRGFGSKDAGMRCASLDGDADRLVYFSVPPESSGVIDLVDGDKMLSLFALFIREQLSFLDEKEDIENYHQATLGVVQTAYANGASTNYLKQLGLEVNFTPTGVKYLHEKAAEYDIGIYFEANGHGTVLFSESFIRCLEARTSKLSSGSQGSEVEKAALRLLAVSKLINQAVGDALSGLLLVEVILHQMGWSIHRWNELYHDLPSRQLKVKVADRTAVITANAETVVVSPPGLQDAINAETAKYPQGRCFVRPSGTEDVVRVYAEASTQEAADTLANSVAKLVDQFLGCNSS